MAVDTRERVIKGIFSMSASSLLSMVLSFLSVTIAARIIPQEDFGVYFLLIAVVYLLEVIGDVGLRLSAAKFVASASSAQEQQAIVKNLLTFRLLSILAISLLAFAAKPLLILLYPSQLISALFIFAPALFAVELGDQTLASIMQGFHLFKKMAVVQTLTSALNLGLTLLFILKLNMGVQGFIVASILSLLASLITRFFMIPVPKALALDRALLRRIITFGLPLQGNDLLTFAFDRMNVLILGALMGPEQIAYLEMAGKIPNYFRRLYTSLNSVYFPNMSELFARQQNQEAEKVLNNFLRLATFVTTFFALAAILFGRDLIVLLFSEKYLPSANALGLLMVGVAVSVASTVLDTALIAAGRPAYLLIINLVTTVVSIGGNLGLIPIFGFMGAVYAKVGSSILANPVSVGCLHREKIRVRISEYLKPALVLAICAGLYLGLGWTTWPLKVLLLTLFVGLSFALSVVAVRDVSTLVKSFRISTQQVV